MALTAPLNQSGATVAISASTPATLDQTGFEALTFTTIGGVVTIPRKGLGSQAGSVASLAEGLTLYYNGIKDFAPFEIPVIYDDDDAGQVIYRAGANGQTSHSLKVTYPSGEVRYYLGVIGSGMDDPVDPGTHQGESFEFRPHAEPVTVAAP